MTPEEIERDCEKFRAYMEANGHQIASIAIGFANGKQLFIGANESLQESLLICVSERLGYNVVAKP